jgi:hypothetical protein
MGKVTKFVLRDLAGAARSVLRPQNKYIAVDVALWFVAQSRATVPGRVTGHESIRDAISKAAGARG